MAAYAVKELFRADLKTVCIADIIIIVLTYQNSHVSKPNFLIYYLGLDSSFIYSQVNLERQIDAH